jgi:RNA polymerase sigma factor (sigma-70 family)
MELNFRRESGRMVAALTRLFGVHNLAMAEDVAQDVLLRALETWKFKGPPQDPQAWLIAAAKNRALDVIRKQQTAAKFAPELLTGWTLQPAIDESFEPRQIQDEELRMIFSCCHPRLAEEVQIALVLQICCGFSAAEIAQAFLASTAALEKRLARGKKVLAQSKTLFEMQGDISARLEAVQRCLYLLFNEGYHGSSEAVRAELCNEAMRLCSQLLQHELCATPSSRALSALFCLHAARLPSRIDAEGKLSSLSEQDRSRWNRELIAQGLMLMGEATGEVSEYHFEAGIAAIHCVAASASQTDWAGIVRLYDLLLQRRPSPVVALSRAIAFAELHGPQRGLEEIRGIPDAERLAQYPFYAAALGEYSFRAGFAEQARDYFVQAARLARSDSERRFFEERARR